MKKWTEERANDWYSKQPWLVGCNFLPSSAINQLEMFQSETFDEETLQKEIGWAAELGFNTLRIYLHDLLWMNQPSEFCERLEFEESIFDTHKKKVRGGIFRRVRMVLIPHGMKVNPLINIQIIKVIRGRPRIISSTTVVTLLTILMIVRC